ncbi:MAG TPA: hypothetical protein DD435_00255 [Cyanobacteria bacterium UBA8530]|nr:hypothetical protein [Cyanobacteria bacterium UBA8530]
MRSNQIKAVLLLLSLSLLAGCAVPQNQPSIRTSSYDTSMLAARKAGFVKKDSLLVRAKNVGDVDALAKENNLTVTRRLSALGIAELTKSNPPAGWLDSIIEKLSADHRLVFVEPNLSLKVKDSGISNVSLKESKDEDPLRSLQYSLDSMSVPEAWKTSSGDPKVVVAVIDSGVDPKHEDLKSNLSPEAYNAYYKKKGLDAAAPSVVSRLGGQFAALGHGTHVAGIIAAEGNNKKGIIGVAPRCTILPVKVFPDLKDNGQNAQDSQTLVAGAVAEGLVYAAEHGAAVINMSLGFSTESKTLAAAVAYALGKGVSVLVAAGNERMEGSPINTLANLPGVIGVGATDEDDKVTYFSNSGKYVSVSAPGWRVLSTMPSFLNGLIGKPYQYMDGTSMACPNAAGVAALVKSVNPSLTPAQVKDILEKSAEDQGPKGFDEDYGFGRLNAARAVALAK